MAEARDLAPGRARSQAWWRFALTALRKVGYQARPMRRVLFAGLALVSLALGCERHPRSGSVEARPASAKTISERVIPTTTAAAELVTLFLEPAAVLALPVQVDDYAVDDFKHGAWATLPRFARYSAEPLLVLHPALVVTHAWQAAETTQVLRSQGIEVLVLESATDWSGLEQQIRSLGTQLGKSERAEAVLRELAQRKQRLAERTKRFAGLRALCYSNDGNGGWAAGAHTTIDVVLGLCSLVNVAAQAGIDGHQSFDFERVVRADPELIVVGLPARGEQGSATRAVLDSTPALAGVRALKEQHIALLSANLLSTDSQHLLDTAEALASELERLFPERR